MFKFLNIQKLQEWSQSSSLWTYHFGTSCCSMEYLSATGPRFDWERFGSLPCDNPNEADLLLVSGPLSPAIREELKKVYSEMKSPKYVIAFGSCAISGGMFANPNGSMGGNLRDVIPVDLFVPGCPPRPEAIMHALIEIKKQRHSSMGDHLDV